MAETILNHLLRQGTLKHMKKPRKQKTKKNRKLRKQKTKKTENQENRKPRKQEGKSQEKFIKTKIERPFSDGLD